jgi:hypothetical protein
VKATDKNGNTAYLQIVGVANGPLGQDGGQAGTAAGGGVNGEGQTTNTTTTKILWQPAALTVPFVLSTFWLGKKYEV